MYIIILLVMGGLIGWLASIVMKSGAQTGIVTNIIVGIVGSFIGNGLLGILFPGTGSIGSWPPSFGALFAAFVGAIILIAVVRALRRRR